MPTTLDLKQSHSQKKLSKSNSLIKLRHVNFSTPSFRKLGDLSIQIADRLTLIAGRNGVGKSTILAIISGTSGIARGKNVLTYFGVLPNVPTEKILRLSYTRDFVKQHALKPQVEIRYDIAGTVFTKKSNISGSQNRLRLVPRNESHKVFESPNLKIARDGKVPVPTIYLGMTRVLPVGEINLLQVKQEIRNIHPDDAEVFNSFTNAVLDLRSPVDGNRMVFSTVANTVKRSLYPNYKSFDSSAASLGQDSIAAIATALASFSKLKRVMASHFVGGLLIIDELDAGLHPHAQLELLKALRSFGRRLEIQVIATTHSLPMLSSAYDEINNKKMQSAPLDGIVYLQGGTPVTLLDANSFNQIYDDMHLQTNITAAPIKNKQKIVKLYVEDDEAQLFLDAILTKARRSSIRRSQEVKLEIVSAKVGDSSLVGLLEADDYFRSLVVVLDGDSASLKKSHRPNVIYLPGDPANTTKQSPEVILKFMCNQMIADKDSYPKTRLLWKGLGVTTDFIQRNILKHQDSDTASKGSPENNREIAKKWFKNRKSHILQYKLIDGWVADNENSVDTFIEGLIKAIESAKKVNVTITNESNTPQ